MGTTKQIPRSEWEAYFDRFTRWNLTEGKPETATVEVVSPVRGDQFEAIDARLLGLSFDPKSDTLEVLLEGVDHLAFHPTEIWVLEDDGGFPASIELVHADDEREILHIHRTDASSNRAQAASPPA